MSPTSNITPRVVHWASQECNWQKSGELSVANMIEAWRYAMRRRTRPPSFGDVLRLGAIVEPNKNHYGLRTCQVYVGWQQKMDSALVHDALKRLVANVPVNPTEAECVEWFRQFEEIHPFLDGNGRTGSLLYSWIRGSLSAPIHAPNLWDDPRRIVKDYPEVIW